jgi:AraC-like DNA-binding protein
MITPTKVVRRSDAPFDATMAVADLGPISAIQVTGTRHGLVRGQKEISRSGERHFRLIVNYLSPWTLEQRAPLSLRAGDLVMLDSALPHTSELPAAFNVLHLKLDENWLKQWLPSPQVLVGRRISDTGWGKVLAAFVGNMTPQSMGASPLPPMKIVDQVGALLSMAAAEIIGEQGASRKCPDALNVRIRESIALDCTKPSLTAMDVAAELAISVRTLHRSLAASGQTFGAMLLMARVDVASRMLASPVFRRLTIAEVGARAGFSDSSYFSRAVRRLSGRTPSQLRAG